MFIELTKENGIKQILNVAQITGVSSQASRHDSTRKVSNIWWAADNSPTQYVESYEVVKSLIERATGTHVLKAGDLTSSNEGDLSNTVP